MERDKINNPHSLLKRHIRRYFGHDEISGKLLPFLEAVNNAYYEFDADRQLMERSLELSSRELLTANSELRAVLQAFPDMFFRLNSEGLILDCKGGQNDDFLQSTEQLIGKYIQDIPYKKVGIQFQDALRQVKKTGEMNTIEYTLEINSMNHIYEARIVPLVDAEVMAIIRNITDQKQLDERLRQSEKMEAIGKLAGGIAHDFNNQLTGIMGFADLLLFSTKDERLKGFSENIVTLAQRSADLTAQLLAFSRKGKYVTETVELHKVINEVVDLLHHSIDKRIKIKRHLDAHPATTMGDSTQLQNVLLNLAINARDAMAEGGELTFTTDNVHLDAEWCDKSTYEIIPGDFICIKVSDTGSGMDQATLNRIFEPFFTTKPEGKGTGMGLAAAYGTVNLHKGSIVVESEPGKGSEFILYLPLVESEKNRGTSSSRVSSYHTGNILVVDDEKLVRIMLNEMLIDMGHSVIVCEDGHDALAYYKQNWQKIDLVILDMSMPVMNGRDTFLAMREINADVRVLLSSGFSIEGTAEKVLKEGVMGFLQKPYLKAELFETVNHLFSTFR